MKKILLSTLFAALMLGTFSASAKRVSFGLGLDAGLPQGDASNIYNLTGGLSFRLNVNHAGPGTATFTTGFVAFAPKSLDGKELKAGLQIPFKFGYKYVVAKPLFVMMEIGYSSFTFAAAGTSGGEVKTESSGGFTYAPCVGVQFSKLEVGIRYESFGISMAGQSSNVSFLALRLGVNF